VARTHFRLPRCRAEHFSQVLSSRGQRDYSFGFDEQVAIYPKVAHVSVQPVGSQQALSVDVGIAKMPLKPAAFSNSSRACKRKIAYEFPVDDCGLQGRRFKERCAAVWRRQSRQTRQGFVEPTIRLSQIDHRGNAHEATDRRRSEKNARIREKYIKPAAADLLGAGSAMRVHRRQLSRR
jgi:hypothetical protein